MRPTMMSLFALFACFALSTATVQKDNTITQVVKILQGMLEKSQTEGDEERVIYAKFKCYCDTSEADKKASIKELTEEIELLSSQIAEIQGDTGGLSSECADLKAKMADNKDARDTAKALRKKENQAFKDEVADLKEAIKDSSGAIKTLATVGADQTASSGAADNKKFMAGFKGASALQVKQALEQVSSYMNAKQHEAATAFLQAPFTGSYTSQSAAVMGMLKSMRDTFKQNLLDAKATEKKQREEFQKFMILKMEAMDEMRLSYKSKQKSLGGNDGDLGSKKKQLAKAEKQKASDEEFLEQLLPMCEKKAKGYETRKMLRANEEAAIAEAISILNSDDAFATFSGTDATSTGATKFIQLHSTQTGDAKARRMAQKVLSDAHSARLSKVVASLQAENPFDTVLDEIDTMLEVIEEEGKQDKENLDWCKSERKENKKSLKEKKADILALKKKIGGLTKLIEHPKTGLKKQIEDEEASLVKNKEAQTTQTAQRLEDNMAYQKDVKNLVAAEGILTKATKVLKAYYDNLADKLEKPALVQEDPKPPSTWDGDEQGQYAGQSSKGGDIIEMLTFIHEETVKEENEAHADEEKAQADYEDSMTELKKKEAESEKALADLQEELAEAEEKLLKANEDLKATTEDKEAIEAYLLKIKPGCDFITKNFGLREKNRGTETAALKKAIRLIKGTPAYKSAESERTVESYGDCKEPCVEDKADVKCKACMADVTIPAYCAGHKGVKGC